MRNIDKIILHCSATPEGKEYILETIKHLHLIRGFSDVGYHYIVHLDGGIDYCRPISIPGAHCRGHNKASIGVCYIGGMTSDMKNPLDTRTPEQTESLLDLIKTLKRLNPEAKVYGHRDFAAKACPSFDATAEYSNI